MVSVVPALIQPGDSVTVTWSVVDPSGLQHIGNDTNIDSYFKLGYSGAYGDARITKTWETIRISGDQFNGVYRAETTVHGWSGSNVLEIWARDNLGNGHWVDFGPQLEVGSG